MNVGEDKMTLGKAVSSVSFSLAKESSVVLGL